MAQAVRTIEILKAGNYPDENGRMVELSEAAIEDIALGYDAELHAAPLVVGHPQHDSPQYGSVSGLKVREGVLLAEIENVHPELVKAVRAGRYSKVSAALYGPSTPANPKPGGFSLRHVGILGGTPPVVKGLNQIQFADNDNEIVAGVMDMPSGGFKVSRAVKAKEDSPMPSEEQLREISLSEREAKLNEQNRKRVARLEERERALRQSEGLAFAERMADEGKVTPGMVAPLSEVLATLDGAAPIEFAEHGGKVQKKVSGAQWLREFVENSGRMVPYGETKLAKGAMNLSEKDGKVTRPQRDTLHAEALKLAEGGKLSYIDAVRQLGG